MQIPGVGKVTEQVLQALGVSTCSDLISHAALLTALLSDISSSSLIEAGLGLGATQHSSRGSGGGGENATEPGRKGISCERTFGAMSSAGEMEAMVSGGGGCGAVVVCVILLQRTEGRTIRGVLSVGLRVVLLACAGPLCAGALFLH